MTQRKPWTEREDQTLKELRETRKISKWSQISHIMKTEFQIFGRNGKQCRERYHNHLDSRICKQKWGSQEEKKLLALHNQWGNRWAAISRELPGRTDNCVKNHFYSCFRKSIKIVNTSISSLSEKKIRPLKLGMINKIIAAIESFHKDPQSFDKTVYSQARSIKMKIFEFAEHHAVTKQNQMEKLQELSKQLAEFNKISRKKLIRKKKVRMVSDESQQIYPKIKINQDDESIENIDLNMNKDDNFVPKKQVKDQPLQPQQSIKIYPTKPSYPDKSAQQIKQQEQHQVPASPSPENQNCSINSNILDQTPKKGKEQKQKQKNSSYYIINSVDYLDVKQCPGHEVRDFIFMDDDKEWKLYFQ